jgi:hypothetical protein
MERDYKRSFFRITDYKFQRDFLSLTLFIALMSTAIVLAQTYFIYQEYGNLMSDLGNELGSSFKMSVSGRLGNLWLYAIIACGGNILTVALLSYVFSTRVSGILFRVTKEINALADGEKVHKINPRENDFFPDLVEAANRLFKE